MDIRERLARTLQAEAGGEGERGLLAAGSVIMNRAASDGFGDGLEDVIMAPGQFSAWNLETGYAGGEGGLDMDKITPSETTYRVTDRLLSGEYDDPTGGALNYYNPSVVEPPWGQRAGGDWKTIGNHIFGTAGNRQPVTQEQRLAFSERHRDELERQQQGINSGETGAFRYDVEGEGFGPGEGLSMGTPVSGDPVADTREAAVREQALDYAVGQRLTQNPRGSATPLPQAGRQQPVMPGRADTLGRNSPQRGDDLLMGSAGEDTIGTNPPGRPSGRPRLSFNLSPDQPLPANPDTSRAFASANLKGLKEDELKLAFGPDVPEIDKGVMGFLGSTIGGPFKYNLEPEDVPQTVSEASEALKERPGGDTPRSRFDAEAYKKREARRIFAADALEVLSVGLGQISAGEPLDLGPTLRAQSERHQQMRAALRGAPTGGGAGSVGGSYSDFLIPGNEDALRQFLIENDADHLLPMVDMGPEQKRLALQGVVDYITTAPERERQARRSQRVIDYYAQTRGPEAAQALAGDPAALEFATEQYYDEVFGEQGGGAAGSWTPQMSEDLASQFEDIGMPDYARAVRNGGQEAYKTFLGELTKVRENEQEAVSLANMSVEERALWGEKQGLDPETSANLAPDVPSLRTAAARAREQRTQQQDLASRRDQMLERAAELNLPANHPLVRGILSGNEDDITTLNRMYEQQVQEEVFSEEEVPVEYAAEEVRNAAADLGPAYDDDLDLFQNSDDPATRQRAAQRIMSAYEEFNVAQAGSRGEALGTGQVAEASNRRVAQALATTGKFTQEEVELAETDPDLAMQMQEERLSNASARDVASGVLNTFADTEYAGDAARLFGAVTNMESLKEAMSAFKEIHQGPLPAEQLADTLANLEATDPEQAARLERVLLRTAGTTAENTAVREIATNFIDAEQERAGSLTGYFSLAGDMNEANQLAYDIYMSGDDTGKGQRLLNLGQGYLTQFIGESAANTLASDNQVTLERVLDGIQANVFDVIATPGVLSDSDIKLALAQFADITDTTMRIALINDTMLRGMEIARIASDASTRYMVENMDNIDNLTSTEAKTNYVLDALGEAGFLNEEGDVELVPEISYNEAIPDYSPSKVVKVRTPEDRIEYKFYGEHEQILQGAQQ